MKDSNGSNVSGCLRHIINTVLVVLLAVSSAITVWLYLLFLLTGQERAIGLMTQTVSIWIEQHQNDNPEMIEEIRQSILAENACVLDGERLEIDAATIEPLSDDALVSILAKTMANGLYEQGAGTLQGFAGSGFIDHDVLKIFSRNGHAKIKELFIVSLGSSVLMSLLLFILAGGLLKAVLPGVALLLGNVAPAILLFLQQSLIELVVAKKDIQVMDRLQNEILSPVYELAMNIYVPVIVLGLILVGAGIVGRFLIGEKKY